MTSSIHSLSDNSEANEQQKKTASNDQNSSPVNRTSLPSIASPAIHYPTPPQLAVPNVQAGYPFPDPYYRSIFAPYDAHSYAAQPYPIQPTVHAQLIGVQHPGVPLPSDSVEEPVFVNAKQYHGILRRRQSRAKAESEKKLSKPRKPYLHESRHLHALRRARGTSGRFQKKNENEVTSNSSQENRGKVPVEDEA